MDCKFNSMIKSIVTIYRRRKHYEDGGANYKREARAKILAPLPN